MDNQQRFYVERQVCHKNGPRLISILVLVIFTLSACDLVNITPTEQHTPSGPTLDPRPIEIATTAPALPEPTATPTQPEPTPRPTRTPIPPTATPTLFPEYQTHLVTDQTGAITINVPTTWTDQQTMPWLDESGMEVGQPSSPRPISTNS